MKMCISRMSHKLTSKIHNKCNVWMGKQNTDLLGVDALDYVYGLQGVGHDLQDSIYAFLSNSLT